VQTFHSEDLQIAAKKGVPPLGDSAVPGQDRPSCTQQVCESSLYVDYHQGPENWRGTGSHQNSREGRHRGRKYRSAGKDKPSGKTQPKPNGAGRACEGGGRGRRTTELDHVVTASEPIQTRAPRLKRAGLVKSLSL